MKQSMADTFYNISGIHMSDLWSWISYLSCAVIFLCTIVLVATAWWQTTDGKWMSLPMFLAVLFIALFFCVVFCLLSST